jgi:uncharacterized protein
MRAVLDTNVFVSGIFWKGKSHEVLASWKEERFILIASLGAISEIVKVLSDFKIRLPDEDIKELVDMIVHNSEIVEPREKIDVVKDDPNDNIFIETAVAGNADYIVSQDKHLLRLKEFRRIRIISPEEFNRLCN